MKPDSYLWKALEFYGRRIHHPGKWRVFDYLLKSKDTVGYSSDMEVERLGLNWKLNPSDFVEGWLYWTGEFEGGDWYHFSRLIQPGAVVFDVGANCGYYSLLTGAMLRERVKVVAFEPSPRTFPRLRTNISLNLLNSSIMAVPIGLSDQSRAARLCPEGGNSGAAFVSDNGDEIMLDTLDSFCKAHGFNHIDVMKIDVEGHELEVLAGGEKTIGASFPSLMIELNDSALHRSGHSAAELKEWLLARGYRLFTADGHNLIPLPTLSQREQIINVFALHN